MSPEIGEAAPEFTLRNQHGEHVALADFRGKSAVTLVFFPLAFTGTCTGELCELRDNLGLFEDAGVELLAVSVDSTATHRVFAEREGYGFQLLADFWPHGAVAQQYGVFLEEKGFADRGTFVIDQDGILRAAFRAPTGSARALDEYREALAAL